MFSREQHDQVECKDSPQMEATLRIPPTHRCHANISMGDLQDPTHGGTLVSTICLAI